MFEQLLIREKIVRIKKQIFEKKNTSPNNRMVLLHAQAELKKYMHLEKKF